MEDEIFDNLTTFLQRNTFCSIFLIPFLDSDLAEKMDSLTSGLRRSDIVKINDEGSKNFNSSLSMYQLKGIEDEVVVKN